MAANAEFFEDTFGSEVIRVTAPRIVRDDLSTRRGPIWIDSAIRKIRSFQDLKAGWNSYSAPRISLSAIETAIWLLNEFALPHLPMPLVIPTADGIVQIEWHARGLDLEIRASSPTAIGLFMEDHLGLIPCSFDEVLDYDLSALRKAIAKLYRISLAAHP